MRCDMKKFWSYAENDKYGVGCTGQTVFVYDKIGNELAKFKDLPYAYKSALSPNGDIFVVKSTEGRLAVYSSETLSLIKKFRYSKVAYGQDDGFCFSPDGRLFINVERQGDSLHSAISVYDTADFSRQSQMLLDESMMISQIEAVDGKYYVLGFLRDTDLVISNCFVGRFADNEIKDIVSISYQERNFYREFLDLKIMGFTEKAYEWSHFVVGLDKLKTAEHSLAKLWKYYSK